MHTHSDSDFRPAFLDRLQERAEEAKANGDGQIAAGKPDEQPLAEWKHKNVEVVHLPDDEQGILRIAVGGMVLNAPRFIYCSFRGQRGQCIAALKQALDALQHGEP